MRQTNFPDLWYSAFEAHSRMTWGALAGLGCCAALISLGFMALVSWRRQPAGLLARATSSFGTIVWGATTATLVGYWAFEAAQLYGHAGDPPSVAQLNPALAESAAFSEKSELPVQQGARLEKYDGSTSVWTTSAIRRDSGPAAEALPPWIDRGSIIGTADPAVGAGMGEALVVLASPQYATPEEARQFVTQSAERLAHDYFHQAHPGYVDWQIPQNLLQRDVIRHEYTQAFEHDFGRLNGAVYRGQMYRAFCEVKLAPALRGELFDCWREHVVQKHVSFLAVLFGMITLLAASVTCYLYVDSRTQGRMRGRLQVLAAASLLLGTAASRVAILPHLDPIWEFASRTFQV